MHPADGNRYHCPWLNHGLTVHADGNVTCGLDDPYGLRSFGNIQRQSVAEVWANPEYERVQRKLWEGHRCIDCDLAQRAGDAASEIMPARSPHPGSLVVETTVRCNLRCHQPACMPNNDRAIRTRDSDFLGLDEFLGFHTTLARALADHPMLCSAIGAAGLVFEMLFPIVLVSRRSRRIIIPLAILFHIGNSVLFHVFFHNLPLLLMFVNWRWLRERVTSRSWAKSSD